MCVYIRSSDPGNVYQIEKRISTGSISNRSISNVTQREALSNYVDRLRHAFRLYGSKKLLNKETKEAAKENIQELFEREPTRKALFMGRFKEHTFIKEFPMKLAGDSSWSYAYIELGDFPRGLYLTEVYSPSVYRLYHIVHVSKATMLLNKLSQLSCCGW